MVFHRPTFCANADGTFEEEYFFSGRQRRPHGSGNARERLAEKLAAKKKQAEAKPAEEPAKTAASSEPAAPALEAAPKLAAIEQPPAATNEAGAAEGNDGQLADIGVDDEMKKIRRRLRGINLGLVFGVGGAIQAERKHKRFIRREFARVQKKEMSSKALPAQFYHRQDAADNAERRAIIHHTSSHYVMAGSRQYERGVRVKGVVMRHSRQGAKLQAARAAKKRGMDAREGARGERHSSGKSKGKCKRAGGRD
mmetsp:Transcript_113774/g.170168  ORF Transcript_113774/g.170168 Transcript_113774/m.170168 type:complete len:253 (-) Transcript_113774:593-1351(-)